MITDDDDDDDDPYNYEDDDSDKVCGGHEEVDRNDGFVSLLIRQLCY